MQIYSIDKANYNYKPVSFGVNLQAKRLQFKETDFFVNINGYGKNLRWAQKIKETADNAVKSIRLTCDFDYTISLIVRGVKEANRLLSCDYNLSLIVRGVKEANRLHSFDNNLYYCTGILRKPRRSKIFGNFFKLNDDLYTPYGKTDKNKNKTFKNKYQTYAAKFDYIKLHPLKNPYRDIELTRPKCDKYNRKILKHAHPKYIDNAFKHIKSIYEKLYQNYIKEDAKAEHLSDINSSVAEIRWILAHATPWVRGSDAISNTLIRAIYKSMGIEVRALKKGVSLDLEAYCTNLNDYQNKFSDYFINKPRIIT